jgi:hypothetical protein
MQLRLSPDQVEAKKALEGAVEEVKLELEAEQDADKKELLTVELKDREAKLDDLMKHFEVRFAACVNCPTLRTRSSQSWLIRSLTGCYVPQKLAIERAKSGEIGIRPSERRRQVEEAQLGGAYAGGRPDAYGSYRLFTTKVYNITDT